MVIIEPKDENDRKRGVKYYHDILQYANTLYNNKKWKTNRNRKNRY